MRELAPGKAAFNRLLPHVLPGSRTPGSPAPQPVGAGPRMGSGDLLRGWRGMQEGRLRALPPRDAVIKNATPPSPHCYLLSSAADELLSAYCVPGIVLRVGHAKAGQVRQVPSGYFL